MECLPDTGLDAGTTTAIVAIALALIAVATLLIVKSRRGRTGALMAIGLVGLLGALPRASAPNAAAGVDCNGQNAVYVTTTQTATATAAGPTVSATVTETAAGPTVTATHTAEGPTVTAPGATVTQTVTAPPSTAPTEGRVCPNPPEFLQGRVTLLGTDPALQFRFSADPEISAADGGGQENYDIAKEMLHGRSYQGVPLCDVGGNSWTQFIYVPGQAEYVGHRNMLFRSAEVNTDGSLTYVFTPGEWIVEPPANLEGATMKLTTQLGYTFPENTFDWTNIEFVGPAAGQLP